MERFAHDIFMQCSITANKSRKAMKQQEQQKYARKHIFYANKKFPYSIICKLINMNGLGKMETEYFLRHRHCTRCSNVQHMDGFFA